MFRHDQEAAQFVDVAGDTERLRLQHRHGVALVSVFHEFGDPVVEGAEFAKQAVKLALQRQAPSLPFWIRRLVQRSLLFGAHVLFSSKFSSKSHAVSARKARLARKRARPALVVSVGLNNRPLSACAVSIVAAKPALSPAILNGCTKKRLNLHIIVISNS